MTVARAIRMAAIRKRAYEICVKPGAASIRKQPMIASRKPTKSWMSGPFRLIMFEVTYPIVILQE